MNTENMTAKEAIRMILNEGNFVWYTRDEIKKLCGYSMPNVNDAIHELNRMGLIVHKGGNGNHNPKKYALKSRVNGDVVEGSKIVRTGTLTGYDEYLKAKMNLCMSTRRI